MLFVDVDTPELETTSIVISLPYNLTTLLAKKIHECLAILFRFLIREMGLVTCGEMGTVLHDPT